MFNRQKKVQQYTLSESAVFVPLRMLECAVDGYFARVCIKELDWIKKDNRYHNAEVSALPIVLSPEERPNMRIVDIKASFNTFPYELRTESRCYLIARDLYESDWFPDWIDLKIFRRRIDKKTLMMSEHEHTEHPPMELAFEGYLPMNEDERSDLVPQMGGYYPDFGDTPRQPQYKRFQRHLLLHI
ncbi:MAG: hypothetical protein NVSMB66_4630 [Candidatus Doudnabacteria bacterium]